MAPAAPPTVIEAAVNGSVTKEQNPHVPRTVDEIVEDSLRCLDAGASIVHHHNDEPNYGGPARHSAGPPGRGQGSRPNQSAESPDAISRSTAPAPANATVTSCFSSSQATCEPTAS